MLEPTRLARIAEERQEEYVSSSPFPHVVIESFLPNVVADELLAAFPGPNDVIWRRHEGEEELKLEFTEHHCMPPILRQFFFEANSRAFLDFLVKLTGITGLVSDPYLEGGGLHQIEPGGFLNVHADFNLHSRLGLDRRLNVLLYLNKQWRDEYGGHLELWDRSMEKCVKRISPSFNRCVIFNTTDAAFHGHPEILRCPVGMTRKSLALYYYTNGRPSDESAVAHRTIFRHGPGESPRRSKLPMPVRIRGQLRRWIPPVVYDLYAAMRRTFARS